MYIDMYTYTRICIDPRRAGPVADADHTLSLGEPLVAFKEEDAQEPTPG